MSFSFKPINCSINLPLLIKEEQEPEVTVPSLLARRKFKGLGIKVEIEQASPSLAEARQFSGKPLTPSEEVVGPDEILLVANERVAECFQTTIKGIKDSKDGHCSQKLRRDLAPEFVMGGVNEKYWIKKFDGRKVDNAALFKPLDGEKGKLASEGGIKEGEGGYGEVVASLYAETVTRVAGIDLGIPPTCLARLTSSAFTSFGKNTTREGSLQMAVSHLTDFGNLADETRNEVVRTLPRREVMKAVLADLWLCNTDRNKGNIALKGREIVLIDHGAIAPGGFRLSGFFEWMNWERPDVLDQPFDEEMRLCIKNVQFAEIKGKIAQLFKNKEFSDERVETLEVCDLLLKKGAAKGLTPREIASFLLFEQEFGYGNISKSPLYRLCQAAKKKSAQKFLPTLEKSLESTLDSLLQYRLAKNSSLNYSQIDAHLDSFIEKQFEKPKCCVIL